VGRAIGCGAARIAGAGLILIGTVGVVSLTTATPALADNCSTEQTIFVQDSATSSSYGTQASVYIRGHSLDSNCSGFRSWSMVNIFSTDKSDQAETGYRQYDSSTFDDVTCYQQGNAESCHLNNSVTISPGVFDGFKVANWPLGTSDFASWINGGSGWIETSSTTGAPFTHGYAMGETGRYGNTSGMLDHHKNLQRKNSSGTWLDWGEQDEWFTSVNNNDFYYHKMSNTAYEVCESGSTCPWQ